MPLNVGLADGSSAQQCAISSSQLWSQMSDGSSGRKGGFSRAFSLSMISGRFDMGNRYCELCSRWKGRSQKIIESLV